MPQATCLLSFSYPLTSSTLAMPPTTTTTSSSATSLLSLTALSLIPLSLSSSAAAFFSLSSAAASCYKALLPLAALLAWIRGTVNSLSSSQELKMKHPNLSPFQRNVIVDQFQFFKNAKFCIKRHDSRMLQQRFSWLFSPGVEKSQFNYRSYSLRKTLSAHRCQLKLYLRLLTLSNRVSQIWQISSSSSLISSSDVFFPPPPPLSALSRLAALLCCWCVRRSFSAAAAEEEVDTTEQWWRLKCDENVKLLI